MRYQKFIVHEYRGIVAPIEIDLTKSPIIPIIGVNECGKTTLLQAIFAFDQANDKSNAGRQLLDADNLYSFKAGSPRVSAVVSVPKKDLMEILRPSEAKVDSLTVIVKSESQLTLEEVAALTIADWDENGEFSNLTDDLTEAILGARDLIWLKSQMFNEMTFTITRDLKTLDYSLHSDLHEFEMPDLAVLIVVECDYIHYFDDFRHEIPSVIDLNAKTEWGNISAELFKRADPDINLESLKLMDARRQRSALSKVEHSLNQTLTREWERFHLEDREALSIHISYDAKQNTLKFEIAEKQESGEEVFFEIKDRSKGFYWFFNFVMRLEFNPRVMEKGKTIYLLDEPGSYLHARAQDRLCLKLNELAKDNIVIYCTHSHYLLSPRTIPINAIRIIDKGTDGKIALYTVNNHPAELTKHSAFQPILEALQVKPSIMEYSSDRLLITEGLYDYFAFDLMKPSEIQVIPGVSADSLRFHISLMMAWKMDYFVLWDNDPEGRTKLKEAEKYFGKEEAIRRFRLLPLTGSQRKRILQDLFSSTDLDMLKLALGLMPNAGFRKVLVTWYYATNRERLKSQLSANTKKNFEAVFNVLWTKSSAK